MKKRLVVVGGGFAGLNLIKELVKTDLYNITLIDKNNFNFFPPLIYQVASGYLEPSSISYPFRRLKYFRKNDSTIFRLGELVKIEIEQNKIILKDGEIDYDYLVLATGTISNFFNMSNIEKNSIPMKNILDSIHVKNNLLLRLEQANIETDPEIRKKLLTIVVTGGGPSGVEISGVLCEMKNYIIPKEYPHLIDYFRVILVEGSDRLLGPMSKKSSEEAYKQLTALGAEVRLNSLVKDYVNEEIILEGSQNIKTKSIIWTAGIVSQTFEGISNDKYGRGKRLQTDEYNKIKGYENIYAIGDTSILEGDTKFSGGHPQLAQVAIQQGRNLAQNFINIAKKNPLIPFKYKDKGSLAIIGRKRAVADLPKKVHYNGFIAYFIWSFIHVLFLISTGNKFRTIYTWIGNYISKDPSLRVIYKDLYKDNIQDN